MSSPPKPPYGELIEKAREDAGLSKREAARRAGISDAWWRYVTEGHQGETPVPGTPDTVAAMAHAVGLSPDRLEAAGRKDAADALADILRREAAAPPAQSVLAPVPSMVARTIFPENVPDFHLKRLIWDLPATDEEKAAMIEVIDRKRAGSSREERGSLRDETA